MTGSAVHRIEVIDDPNWQRGYNAGYRKGVDDTKVEAEQRAREGMIELVDSDFANARQTYFKAIGYIESEFGIDVDTLYFRFNGLGSFSALLVVPLEQFVSDTFLGVFKAMRDAMNIYSTGSLQFGWMFLADNGMIDEDSIESDGYLFKYVKKVEGE